MRRCNAQAIHEETCYLGSAAICCPLHLVSRIVCYLRAIRSLERGGHGTPLRKNSYVATYVYIHLPDVRAGHTCVCTDKYAVCSEIVRCPTVISPSGSFSNYTLFCRSVLASAFSSSETTSVLPSLTALISAVSPSCVMADVCSETLMTSQKGLYIRNLHCKKVHNSRCNSTPSE